MGKIGDFLIECFVFGFIGKVLAETVAAMHGAATRGDEEGSAPVFMENFFCFLEGAIAHGVSRKARRDLFFLFERDKLSEKGVV